MKKNYSFIIFILCIFITSACAKRRSEEIEKAKQETKQKTALFSPLSIQEALASITILDQNGQSETITAKERLKYYQNTNFLTSQPYKKVMRVFGKDKTGKSHSVITSYYENGTIKQYLEIENGRAYGTYAEWHPNGQKKLLATLIAGPADIDEKSQLAWAFDKTSFAWNETGQLITKIPYQKGEIEGVALYFHPNGQIAKEVPYTKGEIDGEVKTYYSNSQVAESTFYAQGVQQGKSTGYWPNQTICWEESFEDDLLKDGVYYDKTGTLISSVKEGTGKRCFFDETGPHELCEYMNGEPEGEVLILVNNSIPSCRYFIKNGLKHGLETIYYLPKPFSKNQNPPIKMTIEWYEGKIHGLVKSWYEDSTLESQKEMSQNIKQGHLSAWYKNGTLMMIEEYEKDTLVRGEYLKKGESTPISRIEKGKGVATLFDADGNFNRKVRYTEGQPQEE